MPRSTLVALALLASAGAAQAQQNYNVAGENSEAIIATEQQRDQWYNGIFNFAPAHRAGDFVFVSGVVAGAWEGEALDREGYKTAIRRALDTAQQILAAAGTSLDAVVKLNSFHVFDHPLITIEKIEQVAVIAEVRKEFMSEPYPAWTAVGTTELLPDNGIVEIEFVVYSPRE